jgi:hypothetical protein
MTIDIICVFHSIVVLSIVGTKGGTYWSFAKHENSQGDISGSQIQAHTIYGSECWQDLPGFAALQF